MAATGAGATDYEEHGSPTKEDSGYVVSFPSGATEHTFTLPLRTLAYTQSAYIERFVGFRLSPASTTPQEGITFGQDETLVRITGGTATQTLSFAAASRFTFNGRNASPGSAGAGPAVTDVTGSGETYHYRLATDGTASLNDLVVDEATGGGTISGSAVAPEATFSTAKLVGGGGFSGIPLRAHDDDIYEGGASAAGETIDLTLTAVTTGSGNSLASANVALPSAPQTITIKDNDDAPTLAGAVVPSAAACKTGGNANSDSCAGDALTLTLTLDKFSTFRTGITWTTSKESGDTAEADDFLASTGTVYFEAYEGTEITANKQLTSYHSDLPRL